MNLLLGFVLGIAALSARAARRDRDGLRRTSLLLGCVVVAVAYYGALRLV